MAGRRCRQLVDLADVAPLQQGQRLVQRTGVALQKAPQASRLLKGVALPPSHLQQALRLQGLQRIRSAPPDPDLGLGD